MRIVLIAGSLREGSYNRALIKVIGEVLAMKRSPEIIVELADIAPIPFYNGDVEAKGLPEEVVKLRERIRSSHGVIIATPEYNYSVPGVLKNTIDWVSRPPDQPFLRKPVGIVGASTGRFGTVRAQSHLRYILGGLGARVMPTPELMVTSAGEKFDTRGHLSDAATREQLEKFGDAFLIWVEGFLTYEH
ncbi:MAG: NADPH-dependent FMN reductase [bacterium]